MTRSECLEELVKHVELDETCVVGRRSDGKHGRSARGETIVMGMADRGGWIAKVTVPDIKKPTLHEVTL